jgi:hypothetical protein
MSDDKNYPSHRITFSEKKLDANGNTKLGQPVEVGVIWPRKEGKQGGIIDWHVSPKKLGDGVYFQLDNERSQTRQKGERDAFDQADAQTSVRDQGLSR